VVGGLKRLPNGKVDYKEDFFDKPAFLTVSGQLQVGERLEQKQGCMCVCEPMCVCVTYV